MKTLNPEEWADLRRVRSIIEHLHHRQWGQWGDPLDSCIKALTKVIDVNEPTDEEWTAYRATIKQEL